MPLFTLETKTPVREMDFFGFTLQYEMSFTSILDLLDLAGIPLMAKDRDESHPIVVAGGPCAYNPEPLTDFVDIFLIGDGEESLLSLCRKYARAKKKGSSKRENTRSSVLMRKDTGIYVPSFYRVEYREDGTVERYV